MFLFAPIRWAIKLCFSLAVAAAIYVAVSAVQVVLASRVPSSPAQLTSGSALVVMGDKTTSTVLDGDTTSRLGETVALVQADKTPRVFVVALGSAPTAHGVLAAELAYLTSHGVKASEITTVTAPNAAGALSQVSLTLGANQRAIVVTDALDALWTKSAASSVGLKAEVAPPPASKRRVFSEISPLLREASAVAVGRVVGYSRASWGGYGN